MPPKTSDPGWKTGEQLEFLLSCWKSFKIAQNAKRLDQFWQRVFDEWYSRWPIPSPRASHAGEPPENLRLMAQKEKNAKIKNWFNNRCRGSDSMKAGRGELKLDVNEKRRLAPVQAYCAYAWESTLRNIVLARWEQQKSSAVFDDDEDPPEESDDTSGGSHIPLAFKLKIAREMYDQLPLEEKTAIDNRREEERNKLYRTVAQIGDEGEREAKLQVHLRNQPHIPKSLLRALKNLEDQTGCAAQLLVASVDPTTGTLGIQKFCQGRTEVGELTFQTHYGEQWEANIEQKFGEWALRVFGDVGSKRREMFTFSNAVLPSTQSISSSTAATLSFQLIPPPTGGSSSRRSAPKKAKPGSPMSVPLPQPSVPEQPPSQPPSLQAHSPVSVQSPDTSEVSQGIPTPALIPPVPVTPSQPVANLSQAAANSSVAANSTQPSVGLPQRTINPSQLLAPPQVAVEPSRSTPEPPKTPSEATATRPASGPAPIPPQAVTPSQLVANPSQTPANSSQVAANPSQPLASPQVAVEPSRSILKPPMISTEAIAIQPASGLAPITPQVITNAADVTTTPPAPGARYRARVKETTASSRSSRRDSIDGAPTIADFEIPSHQDSSDDDTPEVIVDLSEYLNITSDTEDGSHVSSSQKSSDGCQGLLSLPPSSQWRHSSSGREEETASCSQSPPAQDNPLLDTEDLPSWMTKKGQWKYVVSTAGGPDWKKLLEVYLEQERRLEFRDMGATLTHEGRPSKIKEYFQYAHQPSRGDGLTVPDFGGEVAGWWKALQPEWRRSTQDPPQSRTSWSYILSGGSKGVFLVVMCLAWWDRAHARYLDEKKGARQVAVEAPGATRDPGDPPDHDAEWVEIVRDVTSVMEKARNCDVPTRGMPSPGRGAKRKREPEPATPRKKPAARSTSSRTRSKA